MKILETKTINWQPHLYIGWPTILRRSNGELVVAYSGSREFHVCPFGRLEIMTSRDDGKNWSWPRVLLDSAIDDRDGGIVETAKGSLLVTTFSSLAYQDLMKPDVFAKRFPENTEDHLKRWRSVDASTSQEEKQANLGTWLVRSTDGGQTWSTRLPVPASSPHGPITTRAGRLLYPGKALWTGGQVGLWESTDDGLTWELVSEIPRREQDGDANYCELHGVEAADGTLIVHIRAHTQPRVTLQTESRDGGKTWSIPHEIGVFGFPSHLLRLRDNRLLMAYGYRNTPFGNRARISEDHGGTWSDEIILSDDGASSDLGYPSTVELDDGTFLTVWYEVMEETRKGVLRQAHWAL